MYAFALFLLLALAVMALTDLAAHLGATGRHPAVKILAAVILGVGAAYAVDFTLFGAWDVPVRSAVVAYISTGVMLAGLAAVLHEVVRLVRGMGRKVTDEAVEIEETRIRPAA